MKNYDQWKEQGFDEGLDGEPLEDAWQEDEVCMASHREMAELGFAALEAIEAALTMGDEHGYKEAWRAQSVDEHIEHAQSHLKEALIQIDIDNLPKEPLRQALCRLAMALARMEE